jgi:hypothetical protein
LVLKINYADLRIHQTVVYLYAQPQRYTGNKGQGRREILRGQPGGFLFRCIVFTPAPVRLAKVGRHFMADGKQQQAAYQKLF